MPKPRLLIWADTPNVTTGFGNVVRNLFRDAHKEFDVFILGINDYGLRRYDTSKWFVYPVDKQDPYGYGKVLQVFQDCQPDVVFLLQDIFNIQMFMDRLQHEGKPIPLPPVISYFPIDGAPVNASWRGMFEDPRIKKLITYSEWAKEQLLERFPQITPDAIDVLYHGIDTDVFKRAGKEEVKTFRRNSKWDVKNPVTNAWDKKFVMSMVNRYQPRKMVAAGARATSLVVKGYKVCKCGNFYPINKQKCDLNMCGPEDVLEIKPPNPNIALYLHMNVQEPIMGPPPAHLLPSLLINCGFEDADVGRNLFLLGNRNHLAQPLTEEEMALIYTASDINLSTAIGEGFGLSLAESAACGTKSIAPKNSAIPEVLKTTGHLVPNAGLFNMAMDNSHLRPVVDIPALVRTIETTYREWEVNGKSSYCQECVDNVHTHFLWDDKRDYLMKTLRDVHQKFGRKVEGA
jgi:glycosyltransferase involved in cell wall biosynthesis